MSNNSTYINYGNVDEVKQTINNKSNAMRDIFDDLTSLMTQVRAEDVFLGKGSDALGDSYETFKSKFEEYIALVRSFHDTIGAAKESTEDTERRAERRAQELQL